MTDFPYRYAWNRMGRKGQPCRVIARGAMNSCWLEFEDGFQAVTSRNALRRINRAATTPPPAQPARAPQSQAKTG